MDWSGPRNPQIYCQWEAKGELALLFRGEAVNQTAVIGMTTRQEEKEEEEEDEEQWDSRDKKRKWRRQSEWGR